MTKMKFGEAQSTESLQVNIVYLEFKNAYKGCSICNG